MTLMEAALADDEGRRAAVVERSQNVLIRAGAGTGKTTVIIDRLIEMVAPRDDQKALSLERIAAITFTRRAAGELKLRIRSKLLSALDGSPTEVRTRRLQAALGSLDAAFIGTIHGFANRLIRESPMEANLSPGFDVSDDDEPLIDEAYAELLRRVHDGSLVTRFAHTPLAEEAARAERTLLEASESGLLPHTQEFDAFSKLGIDALVRDLLRSHDVPPTAASAAFDEAAFRRAASAYLELTRPLIPSGKGEAWMVDMAMRIEGGLGAFNPRDVVALGREVDEALGDFRKTIDFDSQAGRKAWEDFSDGIAAALIAPGRRWMAHRLIDVRPVVFELYRDAKARHQTEDGQALLIELARILREMPDIRARRQATFDHIFVDEFQDTDPHQLEIILFLAENGTRAKRWQDVALAPGRLTLVGDPEQSIYRFRRADVQLYEDATGIIRRQAGTREVVLSTNFRSTSTLVDWFNAALPSVVRPPDVPSFDGAHVAYEALVASRPPADRPVHLLPYRAPPESHALEVRAAEGRAIAEYLRSLIAGPTRVIDQHSREERPLTYRDVAVLAITTTNLTGLLDAFATCAVPFTAAGGTLFLNDPIQRQFILGLRAISDPEDGVAVAALLRPPFFSIDLWDVVQARAPAGANADLDAQGRGRSALELVEHLRRQRFDLSPGAMARRVLDETAFGRIVALGPNGQQRLRGLRDLCTKLDLDAFEGRDFDSITARAREWIDSPIQLDSPRSIWNDAVQVMSVHQAKGLEFPVVVLWDGCREWAAHERRRAFTLDPSGTQWSIQIQGLSWQEPSNGSALDREKLQADAERRRVLYVAATRARDVLVIPWSPGSKFDKPSKYMHSKLAELESPHARRVDAFSFEAPPTWMLPPISDPPISIADESTSANVAARWSNARKLAEQPRMSPRGVTPTTTGDLPAHAQRTGRFGPLFGETVHRAIRLVLQHKIPTQDAVALAAQATGLDEHTDDAVADVERAVDALAREGLSTAPIIRFEYPVGTASSGALTTGYIDFVAIRENGSQVIIDFKTDRSPALGDQKVDVYVAQLRSYAEMLTSSARTFEVGLLWTESGRIDWL